MTTSEPNPILIVQNRQHPILTQTKERLDFYRTLLQRRFDHSEQDVIKVPSLRGLRLRLPGKPFHSTPEVFFQESGQTLFDLPHETLQADAGDVTLIPARMPHGERFFGSTFLGVVIMFQFESTSLHIMFLEGKNMHIGPIDRFNTIDQFALIRYVDEIANTPEKDIISRRLRQGLYLALLARLIQGLVPSSIEPPTNDHWIGRCKDLIEVYYCKIDFSVAWLSRQMGCSPDHTSRRFRVETGYRIMEVVHRLRIDRARHLLRESDKNIAEIAWACGYSQPSYFNRMFRSLANTTPKEFRHGEERPLESLDVMSRD